MAEERHESQEPNLRGVLVAGAVVTVAIALAVGIGLWLVNLFGGFARPLARAQHSPLPQPHLQPHPLTDRRRYDEEEHAKLMGYQWVDRSAGIVRIPIARAMQILAEQHGPRASPQAAAASASKPPAREPPAQ